MSLPRGTRVGPYEIVAPLGAGGMGEVYRAHDPRLGRDVAIKALPSEFGQHPEALSRFLREAKILASLNHPNIAALYGLEEAGETPYLVLELVEGETLAARLARGALAVPAALALGVQIACAVEAAHERGVIHRDLKPGNVMITPAGVAKVLDFGLAKSDPVPTPPANQSSAATAAAGLTMTGVILGTAAYMSPEQARGEPVDRRSDLWSFACVLFECLAGRAPFTGRTSSELVARILEREPDWSTLPSGVPQRARELLRRCLRKDADARPRDVRDVRLELAELAGGPSGAGGPVEQSIAVLPFENLSGVDDEYFADGITEEILNALANLEGLRVAARSSCFAFKGRREDLRAVGEKLDVTTVLEGSVRRAGAQLRITVQLVNAESGYQLWSERYDRHMTDVFELQDEIAGNIATRLRGTLRSETERGHARQGTKNLEAYELLLRGRALQNKRGRFLGEAIACLERAIAIDPDYADALAVLSDSYRLMGTFGTSPYAQVMPKARAIAESALAIDPRLAEAWATIACVEEQYEWQFARAERTWQRVFELDPRNTRGRVQHALWRLMLDPGARDASVAESRRAVHDDPLNSWVKAMHSHVLGVAGMHAESIASAEEAVEIDPEAFFSHWTLMRGHAWAGHYERALQLAPGVLRDSGRNSWVLGALAWVYGKMNRVELARAVHDELEGRSRHEFESPFWLATAAAAAGLPDATFRYVERALSEHDPLVVWGRRTPFWDQVRAHPGTAGALDRIPW